MLADEAAVIPVWGFDYATMQRKGIREMEAVQSRANKFWGTADVWMSK